jgi:hypothetical protein
MAFSEVCNGHEQCPYCGKTTPKNGNTEKGCCTEAADAGMFWDISNLTAKDDPVHWLLWHSNDECANPNLVPE